MNIQIVISTFDLGGAEKQAIFLASGLSEKGYTVELVALGGPEGNGIEFIKKNNIEHRSLDLKFWDRSQKDIIIKELQDHFNNTRVDVIIPFTYWPNLYCGLSWKKTTAMKCMWNQRDEGYGMLVDNNELVALENASYIISNSEGGKEFLVYNFNLDPERVTVIHNGIERKDVKHNKKDLKVKLGLSDFRFICIMVSNINDRKDHLTLVEAWNIFSTMVKSRKDISLIIIGKKAEKYSELITRITDLGLERSIIIRDFQDDVSEYLTISDVGVLSSFSEGLPNVIMEYMMYGLPVVATDLRGIREILGDKYPFLFKKGDSEQFAKILMYFFRNPLIRKLYSLKNRLIIYKNFSTKMMVSRYIDLLQEK